MLNISRREITLNAWWRHKLKMCMEAENDLVHKFENMKCKNVRIVPGSSCSTVNRLRTESAK